MYSEYNNAIVSWMLCSATSEHVISTVDWSIVRARRNVPEYWSIHGLLLHLSHQLCNPATAAATTTEQCEWRWSEVWGRVDVWFSTQLSHKEHHVYYTRCPLYITRCPQQLWIQGLLALMDISSPKKSAIMCISHSAQYCIFYLLLQSIYFVRSNN